MAKHIIDCDADPFIDDPNFLGSTLKAVYHKKGGQLELDVSDIKLYLSPNMETSLSGKRWIRGSQLIRELRDQPVLNANVLQYFLIRPELIPEEWKGKLVCFWGTIYSNPNPFGIEWVPALQWRPKDDRKFATCIGTHESFVSHWPAAIFEGRSRR